MILSFEKRQECKISTYTGDNCNNEDKECICVAEVSTVRLTLLGAGKKRALERIRKVMLALGPSSGVLK